MAATVVSATSGLVVTASPALSRSVAPSNHTGAPMRRYPVVSSTKAPSSAFLNPIWSAMVPERMGRK